MNTLPNLSFELNGLSLAAAFKQAVLNDKKVSTLGREVIHQTDSHREVFEDGQFPGVFIDFTWPLDIKESELAFAFVRPTVSYLGEPLPTVPEIIRQAANALCEALSAFRELLVQGQLEARGTYARTGMVGSIDRLQWARSNVEIDARDSDLKTLVDGTSIIQWTGISVHLGKENKDVEKSKAAERVETIAAAKTACTNWLMESMRASPSERRQPKAQYREEALAKWHGKLSARAFDSAWDEAIRATGANTWSQAGAPKKSQQSKSPR